MSEGYLRVALGFDATPYDYCRASFTPRRGTHLPGGPESAGLRLPSQKGRLYREVTAKVLTDGEATKDDILDGLDRLRKETTSKDVAMLFLAGHGVNDTNGIYYFLPTNANPDKLLRTGVVFSDIKNTLASIAGKTLFFVDTCHSGNIMGARRGVADINAVVNELVSAENGAVVFASSTGAIFAGRCRLGEWRLYQGAGGEAGRQGGLHGQGHDRHRHAGLVSLRAGQVTHRRQADSDDETQYCSRFSDRPAVVGPVRTFPVFSFPAGRGAFPSPCGDAVRL